MKRYRNVKLFDEDSRDLDEYMNEILERRKLEKVAEAEAGPEDFSTEETEAEADTEADGDIEIEAEDDGEED
jgi:DNA-directed RNA polymerase subunit beta'